MRAMHGRPMRTGAALIAGLGFLSLAVAVPEARAQSTQTIDARDLVTRLQRVERDLHDLQAETYRRTPGASPQAPSAPAPVPEPPPEVQPPPPVADLTPLLRRMDELEESIGRFTGQMEELGHRVDQLSQRADRLQKQIDFQAREAKTPPAADAQMPPVAGDMPPQPAPDAANAVASLTPSEQTAPAFKPPGAPPANLGQIPAGTRLPPPAPLPADPKREFDTAMNLLARAQYGPASDAFRKFADDHPDEDRAPDALYWTGNIAYSAKKDYPEAARDFAELLKKYPMAQRAPEGMLNLGLALFQLGQMNEGCAALAALPAKYPDASMAIATRAKAERTNNRCK